MAVKKVAKKENETPNVEVQETPVVETDVEETSAEPSVDTDVDVEETEVDVETPQEEKEPEVTVDSEAVEDKTVATKNVRVRVKVDHRCFIGGELYDLKADQCYNVPEFVKKTLNRAGILAPL